MSMLRFQTADGLSLEGELRAGDPPVRGTAVLCHPHPQHGGSKDHPLLWALRNELAARRRLTVLAFNFRGVMGSEGRYGGGEAELADVDAAVERVRREADGPTVLCGWSFGAWVALRHATGDRRVAAVVLVAMPLGGSVSPHRPLPSLGDLEALTSPVLLVAGGGDPICPLPHLRNLAGWIPRSELIVVEGADHFFGRHERQIATRVGHWVDRVLVDQASGS